MLLVYYSGSTHATWEDHLRKTVHAATIKDLRPGYVLPFSVFVLFRERGILDREEIVFLGGTCRFEKQRWSLRDMGRGGTISAFNLDPDPRFLFATRRREEPKHQQHEYTMGGHVEILQI